MRTRSWGQRKIKASQRRREVRWEREKKEKKANPTAFPGKGRAPEISPSLSLVPPGRSSFCQAMAHLSCSFLFHPVTIDSSTGFYLSKGPITMN